MYCDQRSQYIRPKSKKNNFRGNYLRKYSIFTRLISVDSLLYSKPDEILKCLNFNLVCYYRTQVGVCLALTWSRHELDLQSLKLPRHLVAIHKLYSTYIYTILLLICHMKPSKWAPSVVQLYLWLQVTIIHFDLIWAGNQKGTSHFNIHAWSHTLYSYSLPLQVQCNSLTIFFAQMNSSGFLKRTLDNLVIFCEISKKIYGENFY